MVTMARRKKYPKLPNGFGSIKYLGKNRTNPYGVYPPTTEFDENGVPKTQKAITYVDDWYYGFSILLAYKAGTYVPGVYPEKKSTLELSQANINLLVGHVRKDLGIIRQAVTGQAAGGRGLTFSEVYEKFYKYKFEDDKSRTYSKSACNSVRAAYLNCKDLHSKYFKDLHYEDLQRVVDTCTLKHSSLELIVSLLHQIYKYADMIEIVDKDYSEHVRIKIADDDVSGEPFSDEELKILWNHKDDPVVEFILIMCYSGFRISAYLKIETNLEDRYFKGGVKNRYSKDRIVPIHSAILPLVASRLKRQGSYLSSTVTFRVVMYKKLEKIGIQRHTPHDCRHTFSKLCEQYEVKENDRKRMLGHSFGQDITNSVYGHRSTEELREQIEKIKVCY